MRCRLTIVMIRLLLFAILVITAIPAFPADTTGVYVPSTGQWLLRISNTAGDPNINFTFGGLQGDLPVAGDWDGDGRTDFGIFREGTFFRARLSTTAPPCLQSQCPPHPIELVSPITFGQIGDLPVAGDWNGDGIDDVGVFRPGFQGTFLLRLRRNLFVSIRTVTLGTNGDKPVAGDWNGDGIDDVGVFQPTSATFVLSEDGAKPTFFFAFGLPGNRPVAGDWLGSGQDGIGVFQSAVPTMVLSPEIPPQTEIQFHLGVPSEGIPVAGRW